MVTGPELVALRTLVVVSVGMKVTLTVAEGVGVVVVKYDDRMGLG